MTDATASRMALASGATPPRAGLVLSALIVAALVCNINLAAANIALPQIGDTFDAGQTSLNLVALGCSLGLAMSVLYWGAIADRYGRKQLLLVGLALTVAVSFLAAFAPTIEMLILARLLTGVAAGMAYPTTLSLITALWASGPRRTKAIALWSSVSAMSSVVGAAVAGFLLELFWWGSAFLLAVPIAVVGFVLVILVVPSHVAESDEPVDHFGGVVSVLAVGAFVLGLGIVFTSGERTTGLVLIGAALVLIGVFAWRQLRVRFPLYDLTVAKRRLFWVPAVAGMIVFGSLMGVLFVGQQFLQDVLGYNTLEAGLATLPAAVALLVLAPVSARFVTVRGIRATMLMGYGLVFAGFATTLFWRENTPYWLIGVGFFVIGCGVTFAMTPASRALTDSTPVRRVGMASATSDLQRDLGGSIMQALLGAILAAGFARSFGSLIASSPDSAEATPEIVAALESSYSSATETAKQYPQFGAQIMDAATQSLVQGSLLAYSVGAIAIVIGAVLVATLLPGHGRESELLARYALADAGR